MICAISVYVNWSKFKSTFSPSTMVMSRSTWENGGDICYTVCPSTLVMSYLKIIQPHTDMYLEKIREIIITLSDNYGYSLLILYQNSVSVNLLETSYNVECENINKLFRL